MDTEKQPSLRDDAIHDVLKKMLDIYPSVASSKDLDAHLSALRSQHETETDGAFATMNKHTTKDVKSAQSLIKCLSGEIKKQNELRLRKEQELEKALETIRRLSLMTLPTTTPVSLPHPSERGATHVSSSAKLGSEPGQGSSDSGGKSKTEEIGIQTGDSLTKEAADLIFTIAEAAKHRNGSGDGVSDGASGNNLQPLPEHKSNSFESPNEQGSQTTLSRPENGATVHHVKRPSIPEAQFLSLKEKQEQTETELKSSQQTIEKLWKEIENQQRVAEEAKKQIEITETQLETSVQQLEATYTKELDSARKHIRKLSKKLSKMEKAEKLDKDQMRRQRSLSSGGDLSSKRKKGKKFEKLKAQIKAKQEARKGAEKLNKEVQNYRKIADDAKRNQRDMQKRLETYENQMKDLRSQESVNRELENVANELKIYKELAEKARNSEAEMQSRLKDYENEIQRISELGEGEHANSDTQKDPKELAILKSEVAQYKKMAKAAKLHELEIKEQLENETTGIRLKHKQHQKERAWMETIHREELDSIKSHASTMQAKYEAALMKLEMAKNGELIDGSEDGSVASLYKPPGNATPVASANVPKNSPLSAPNSPVFTPKVKPKIKHILKWKCSNCQREQRLGTKFCSICGQKMATLPTEIEVF